MFYEFQDFVEFRLILIMIQNLVPIKIGLSKFQLVISHTIFDNADK